MKILKSQIDAIVTTILCQENADRQNLIAEAQKQVQSEIDTEAQRVFQIVLQLPDYVFSNRTYEAVYETIRRHFHRKIEEETPRVYQKDIERRVSLASMKVATMKELCETFNI